MLNNKKEEVKKIKEFLKKEGFKNIDNNNYIKAFTHSTYINEFDLKKEDSFDRLEFLGDSILGKEVSLYIYSKFENFNSGNLSLLKSNSINEKILAKIAKNLKLNDYFFLGKGENKVEPPISMFADILEALIAAIYLAEGREYVLMFLSKHLFPYIDSYNLDELKDYKTLMQELLAINKENKIQYVTKLISNKKDSKPYFSSSILNHDIVLGRGEGNSKKIAEKKAAKEAYKKIVK